MQSTHPPPSLPASSRYPPLDLLPIGTLDADTAAQSTIPPHPAAAPTEGGGSASAPPPAAAAIPVNASLSALLAAAVAKSSSTTADVEADFGRDLRSVIADGGFDGGGMLLPKLRLKIVSRSGQRGRDKAVAEALLRRACLTHLVLEKTQEPVILPQCQLHPDNDKTVNSSPHLFLLPQCRIYTENDTSPRARHHPPPVFPLPPPRPESPLHPENTPRRCCRGQAPLPPRPSQRYLTPSGIVT